MRALRTSLAVAWLAGIAPALAGAQAQHSPEFILEKFHPTQRGVDYDVPAEKAAISACKVDKVYDAKKKPIGFELRDGQGQLLRRFVDSNGKGSINQWSYYQNGFEVYREVDLNGDRSLDECRWLNAGGTRIAEVKTGKIVGWRRISAEEASKVLVQALASTPVDLALIETVMATPEELKALGLPRSSIEQAAKDGTARQERVTALRKNLAGWTRETTWTLFDGKLPHVIPADPGLGLAADLLLYENPLVLVGPANGQGSGAQMAYLQASEMVKIGEVWKFVDLPVAIDPQKPLPATVADRETIRSAVFGQVGPNVEPRNDAYELAIKELAAYDKKGPAEGKRGQIQFYIQRIKLLGDVVKAATKEADKLAYNKQVVDSLIALHQTGQYPPAAKAIDSVISQGGKVASYAAFRKITADYAIEADDANANPVKVQAAYMEKLTQFLKDFPGSDEEPDALFQLASINEFNNEEKDARQYYTRLAEQFATTESGKKAAGALRRIDLVGKPIELSGKGLDGTEISASKFRGKPLVVLFWTAAAEAGRRDLPELLKVQEKQQAKGLEVLGVCLDSDKAAVGKFLKDNDLPWPQILEPKGMDGDLANQFGIISLPTMFLIDAQGKVVNRNVRSAADLEKQLDKDQAVRAAGLNVDDK